MFFQAIKTLVVDANVKIRNMHAGYRGLIFKLLNQIEQIFTGHDQCFFCFERFYHEKARQEFFRKIFFIQSNEECFNQTPCSFAFVGYSSLIAYSSDEVDQTENRMQVAQRKPVTVLGSPSVGTRGPFVVSSRNVTDDVIVQYIALQSVQEQNHGTIL